MKVNAVKQPSLHSLPDETLERIVLHVLSIGKEVILTDDPHQLKAVVYLSRTSDALRRATSRVIQGYRLGGIPIWPSVKMLGPHASNKLRVLDITVDRSVMFGFLKWLLPAQNIEELKLKVVGEAYSEERLTGLEKMLLGRLFTNTGARLHTLHISGINCQSLFFTSLFNCTQLRSIHVDDYGDTSGTTVLTVFTLVLLANRANLQRVVAPFETWKSRMNSALDGESFARACEVTWSTIWASYRAGMKESVMNLEANEKELEKRVRSTMASMDKTEHWMRAGLERLKKDARGLDSGAVPEAALSSLIPFAGYPVAKLVEQGGAGAYYGL
ncbi:hypothetical protein FGB62_182g129 [Gracilaria domingensis]|nr:hypothetical protein FGB62_182g129 [Gracilaria domingensis]